MKILMYPMLWVFLVGLVALNPVFADQRDNDKSPNATLQLDTFVREVLERNASLKSLTQAVESARQSVSAAGALPDPFISYAGAPDSSSSRRGYQDRVEVSQVLPWPGKLDLKADKARAMADASALSLDDHKLQVIAAAKQLYAEWAYVHTSLSLKHQHRELLHEVIQVAEARYSAGTARQQDVLQAQVEAASIDTDIISHRRRIIEVQALINALLNKPADSTLRSPGALPEPVLVPSLARLQRSALDTHPELDRLRANITAAKSQLGLAEKDLFPDFKFSGGYNSLWDDTDKRLWLGVTINIPIDFSNKRDANKQAAKADVMRQQWALSDRESYLVAELAQARARMLEISEILDIYAKRFLPLAKQSFDSAMADYRAGKGSFLNVIDAQRKQLRTEDNHLRAQANYLRELSALERYVGDSINQPSLDTTPLSHSMTVDLPESVTTSAQW